MLNFAVGPVMIDREILKIGSEQIPYFRTDEFSSLLLENQELLLDLVGAPLFSRVIFLTGSGTAAMEAAVLNTLTDKDKVLVVNGGTFGKRFKEICDVYQLESEELRLNHFEPLTEKHLEPFDSQGFTALLVNVHETSTGVLYDMNLIKRFCEKNGLFLIVDAISSFLADPYDMADYGVNVTILSSQKALALPPGMSYVVVDQEAQARIMDKKVNSLYFKFQDYLRDGIRGQTPYTPAVSNLIQLNRRLKMIESRGLSNVIKDVALMATDFRCKIADLPLKVATTSPSNALTAVIPTCNIDAYNIFTFLKDEYGIFVVPSGGELRSKMFRVGHIGAISLEDNLTLVEALRAMSLKGLL